MRSEDHLIRVMEEEYIFRHPEIRDDADLIKTTARECPGRDAGLPYALNHDDAHVKGCVRCKTTMAEKGHPYPE
jgi:hypothetical protein